ncbi:hypothetical protein [Sphaerisporangium sp. TRM90804]|uniref:hypothetical protein n=1 Tax=Sphaerisporangium sp. TRM90804 TaxID=3031113 RepID=UPI0024473F04|nr:hypothetical protein [Sphaerisporangium sp. TRM90804]MDH2424788.1 hypothetical protein [Sphaerisporangium sp. TRM90804]
MPEIREYACCWTDWDTGSDEKTRVRYDIAGSGDEGLRAALNIARQTRAWQPHQGLPADADVVYRSIGDWQPMVVAPQVLDAEA